LIASAIGAGTLYFIRDLSEIKSLDPAGPGAFPTIISWLMIGIGIVHIAGAMVVIRKAPKVACNRKTNERMKPIVLICIACTVYCLLLESVGYIFMTPFLIVAIMMSVGERNLRNILTTSIFTTALLFCVFYFALNVNMPLGILQPLFN
jgi:hypothetical protein